MKTRKAGWIGSAVCACPQGRKCKATLLLTAALLCSTFFTHGNSIARSSMELSSLSIVAGLGGTVEFTGPLLWSLSAFSEAANSLGELDQQFDASVNGSTSANSSVTYSTASASGDALGGVSILGRTFAESNIPLCDSLFATATARSRFENSFRIIGGSGDVEVDFAASIKGFVEGITDACGISAEAEMIFALSLDGQPFLFHDQPMWIGPQEASITPLDETLSGKKTLQYGAPYELLIELDSETRSETRAQTIPETLGFAPVAAALMSSLIYRRRLPSALSAPGTLAHGSHFAFRRAPSDPQRTSSERNHMKPLLFRTLQIFLGASFAGFVPFAQAKYIGADPPCPCDRCGEPSNRAVGEGSVSLSEGNLQDTYPVISLGSGHGPTLSFSLTYNSYNADGSRALVDTVLGYGWTHSYNVFLFLQRGHAFRYDGEGRVTKYVAGPGGTFTTDTGYFETLVNNGDGSFTLTQKDETTYRFESVPGTPFLVAGPVWRLVRIEDRNHNVTMLTYTSGNLTKITDTYDRFLTLEYNAQNKLIRVTDPLEPIGRVTRFTYDATGRRLTRITDPLGRKILYSYNSQYQLTSKKDKDERLFTYTYQNNKPVSMRDSTGAAWFTLANPNKWATDANALANSLARVYLPSTTQNIDGRGHVWRYEYDSHGYITKRIAPDGATTTYTYDADTLRMSSMTDANGHATQYEYDTQGNTTKVTDHLGNATVYTYEPSFNMVTSVTDPNGRQTTYEYDPAGNRISETQAVGLAEERARTWTYDSHGNVLTETDWRGFETQYTYDAFGNRATMTEAVGTPEQRTTRYTYDAVGNLTEKIDPLGRVTRYQYDPLDRLIRLTEAFGTPSERVTTYSYDNRGNRLQVRDCNGNTVSYQYDQRSRLIKTTDALGKFESQTYDGNGNLTSFTDKNNHTTNYSYDVQNRLKDVTDALANVTHYEYDGVGNLLCVTDARNNSTCHAYDAVNRRITTTAADGGVTTFEYATVAAPCCTPTLGSALVSRQTDGNLKVTCYKYDNLNRLVRQIRKQGDTDCSVEDAIDDAIIRYAYDANDNRLTVTEPNGNTTTYEYDPLNRRRSETNAAGEITRYEYDAVDNRVRVFSPNGNVTDYTYDPLNRLIQVADLEGPVRGYTYDCVGNRGTDTDGNGHSTGYTYDALYRVIKVTDPMGQITLSQYDPVGNPTKVTDREGNVTTYVYDDINRRTQMCEAVGTPVERCTDYAYDPVGNLIRLTDCNGHATTYEYDPVNRRTLETYPDALPNTRQFFYDLAGNVVRRIDQKNQVTDYDYTDLYFLETRDYPFSSDDHFTYDLSGRMLTAERGGWLVEFEYDGANRVDRTIQNGRTVDYAYNIPVRTRQINYPGGRVTTDQYDFRSRLRTIDDGGSPPPIVTYAYDAANRVRTRAYRNGTVGTYSYNDNDWVTSLNHTAPGPVLIAGFGYQYDKEGNKKCEDVDRA